MLITAHLYKCAVHLRRVSGEPNGSIRTLVQVCDCAVAGEDDEISKDRKPKPVVFPSIGTFRAKLFQCLENSVTSLSNAWKRCEQFTDSSEKLNPLADRTRAGAQTSAIKSTRVGAESPFDDHRTRRPTATHPIARQGRAPTGIRERAPALKQRSRAIMHRKKYDVTEAAHRAGGAESSSMTRLR